ncbi:carboxymuconolactone decarboxylase family protein [Actinoplanes cyaneus]|uniref:carboxymuconolactone decarboxylase family protein n=1 Tax=Actinoplanes cyaneus TaxID=52696 RepID=UPI0031D4109A
MATLLARGARRLSLRHIRRLTAVPPSAAPPRVRAVYDQVETEFGMLAPPVALHAAAPEVLDAVWLMLRETLLAGRPGDRAEKEAVAAAVSAANSCPYCTEVHGAALAGLRPGADARLIAGGRVEEVRDPRLRSLARWARDGRPPPPDVGPSGRAAAIGVAVTFHYLNRMVNIFLEDSPLAGAPAVPRAVGRRAAPRLFGRLARTRVVPGRPATTPHLPGDLTWAAPIASIGDAMVRACAAIEAGGAAVLPGAVRDLVEARLDDPRECGPGLGLRPWADAALRDLPEEQRAVGRLALLAAYASSRVADADIAAVRAAGLGDGALVRLTAWASMAAARRAGRVLSAGGTG